MKQHPTFEAQFDEVYQRSQKRKQKTLEAFRFVLKNLAKQQASKREFSATNLSKEVKKAGGSLNSQTIRNQGDYNDLLKLFKAEQFSQVDISSNHMEKAIEQVNDPTAKSHLREVVYENHRLKTENDAMRKSLKTRSVEDFPRYGDAPSRKVSNALPAASKAMSSLPAFKATELKALKSLLDEGWHDSHGHSIEDNGSVSLAGERVLPPGSMEMLKKVEQLLAHVGLAD